MVYKEDVDRIIFRTRTEILDLKDQLKKYQEKKAVEIRDKSQDLGVLEELAPTLPLLNPELFDDDGYEVVDDGLQPVLEIEAPEDPEEPIDLTSPENKEFEAPEDEDDSEIAGKDEQVHGSIGN